MKKLLSLLFFLFISMGVFAQQNLVVNGDFTDNTNGWSLKYQNSDDMSKYVISTTDGLEISQTEKTDGRLDIFQDVNVYKNTEYILSFDYKTTHKKIRVWSYLLDDKNGVVYLTDDASTDELRTKNLYLDVTEDWGSYSCSFKVPDVDTIPMFRVEFRRYKQQGSSTSLKNVSLTKKSTSGTDNIAYIVKPYKFIENGKLYIRKGEQIYDIFGNSIK